jgi:Salmonella virulence plasmid 65kDa B protein
LVWDGHSASRDTAKSVPMYDDESDVFLLSGAEQLVPVSSPSAGSTRYRPHTAGLFARITHIQSEKDDYWEVRSRNGWRASTVIRAKSVRISGRDEPGRPPAHLLPASTQTVDPFGSPIEYLYEREPTREEGPPAFAEFWTCVSPNGAHFGPGSRLFEPFEKDSSNS